MKIYTVIFHQSQWYRLDIDNFELYTEGLLRDSSNTLITFQSGDLIRSLMLIDKRRRLPQIIDLESLDKQMSQQGKEFRNDKPWKLLKMLKYHGIIKEDHQFRQDAVKELLELMAASYRTLLEKDELEKERFEQIESSVNEIIYKRQSEGIPFDTDEAKSLCIRLEKEIYRVKNVLQFEHRIYAPDDIREQKAYIDAKNYKLIKSPLFTFKARRNDDSVCRLFYEMLRSEQDLNSVLYMLAHWGGPARCYPVFFGFGTITSRVTVREPSLQNLRKTNRSVISADPKMKLLYVDYSQFEAGILASLSEDPFLITLYNTDIYEDLARTVFGDASKRADAKILFYRYIYGDTTLNQVSMKYFQKFKKMVKFKADVEAQIMEHKKIGTDNGNFRSSNGEDHGWSLSHKIQATASLIYKNAVIRVANEYPTAKFMIPMHDATLYQVDEFRYLYLKTKIAEIYKAEFKAVCPNIDPEVTVTDKFS
jgi:DNA polymerase I-like protein with 3'-5' exonuclease and polymerase domains